MCIRDRKAPYALQHLVVLVPKSMKFEALNGAQFQTMQNGPMAGAATVEVAQQTQPGQSLSFKVSGTGTLPAETEQSTTGGGGGGGEGGGGGGRNVPGGGLGAPTGEPDPLQSFKWYILGFFVVVLGGGAWFITTRKPPATATASASAALTQPAKSAPAVRPCLLYTSPSPRDRTRSRMPSSA